MHIYMIFQERIHRFFCRQRCKEHFGKHIGLFTLSTCMKIKIKQIFIFFFFFNFLKYRGGLQPPLINHRPFLIRQYADFVQCCFQVLKYMYWSNLSYIIPVLCSYNVNLLFCIAMCAFFIEPFALYIEWF